MQILNPVIILLLTGFSLGCASLFVPGQDEISKLPVVKMGDPKPQGNEYILHIPAGASFPVDFSINGNLVSGKVQHTSTTSLNRELYLYKHWASLDGKAWQPTRDLIHMPITIGLDSEGGQVKIQVDRN